MLGTIREADMKARIQRVEEAQFVAESGSGHAVVIAGPPEGGGRNLGVRLLELELMGVGACTAYDVVHILRKSRQPVERCVAELEAERAEREPMVFTKIHVHLRVAGRGLGEQAVKRAVDLSAEKYCSASIMLGCAGVEITHAFEIVEPGAR